MPKKKIAIISAPLHGHVNPTLAFTEELVKRGHDVLYLTLPEFQAKVEATGARFESYGVQPSLMAADPEEFRKNRQANRFADMMAEWAATLPQLRQILTRFKPDTLVYDFFTTPGHAFACETGVPAVKFFTTYTSSQTFDFWTYMRKLMPADPARDQAEAAFPKEIFVPMLEPAPTNLLFMPRAFHMMGESFDDRYHFVGPCLRTAETGADIYQARPGGRPLVLVSMGSVLTKQPGFYKICFEVFRDRAVDVVMAIGHEVDPGTLGNIPANVTLLKYVPQLALLKKARAFISHGGMNSTMESLALGVPLIVTPHSEEQEVTARRVQELGLGLHLNPLEITTTTLGNALDHVLGNGDFKKSVARMAELIRESGGTERAATLIENA